MDLLVSDIKIDGGTAIAVEDRKLSGTETGDDSEIQVPVFSPRKARPGRLIK